MHLMLHSKFQASLGCSVESLSANKKKMKEGRKGREEVNKKFHVSNKPDYIQCGLVAAGQVFGCKGSKDESHCPPALNFKSRISFN